MNYLADPTQTLRIGIMSCVRNIDVPSVGVTSQHCVFEKYVKYVSETLAAAPVLIPAVYSLHDRRIPRLLRDLDGVLLPGSPSNVGLRREGNTFKEVEICLLYTSPSPRDATLSRMPSSA